MEPKLTGLRHIGTSGLYRTVGYANYYQNYNGERGARSAYPIGDSHIVVIYGRNQWTLFDYALVRISDGQIVDTYYDANGDHLYIDHWAGDVFSNRQNDHSVRHAKFEDFTVVASMMRSSSVRLTIFSVSGDSLEINTVTVFDEGTASPSVWPYYNNIPPTLIKTGPSSVTFITAGYQPIGAFQFIFMDISVTSTTATLDEFRAYPYELKVNGHNQTITTIVVDPAEVGHREVIGFFQTFDPNGTYYQKDFYRVRFDTSNGQASMKQIASYPDLHHFRYQWRAIATAGGFHLVEEGGQAPVFDANTDYYPGGRSFFYSIADDEIVRVDDIRPSPAFDATHFQYGTLASTHWFGNHPHSLVVAPISSQSNYYYSELLNVDSALVVGPSNVVPPDPTGAIPIDTTRYDDTIGHLTQVVDGKYFIFAYGGWGIDEVSGEEDWETWILLYEREQIEERIDGRRRSQRLSFSHVAR